MTTSETADDGDNATGMPPPKARKKSQRKQGSIAAQKLRSGIERIERLEEERKALGSDIKDIYAEMKSAGFDTSVIRTVIKIRKQEPAQVEEHETLKDVYVRALETGELEGLAPEEEL